MNNNARPRILIMAGGTGGHVFPALAVAQRIQTLGFEVLWLGTPFGLEAKIIPEASLPIRYINITGLRGKGLKTLLLGPFRLLNALFQALAIIREYKPNVVLGMGGYVSGPGGLAAWLLRYPLVVHEQNSIAGLTNRWLARLAKRVLEGFPKSFPAKIKAHWVGNPVRDNFGQFPLPETRLQDITTQRPLRLLIVGGSQGATALNQLLPKVLGLLPTTARPKIWHQTGLKDHTSTRAAYNVVTQQSIQTSEDPKDPIRVDPFIEDMAAAFAWCDLVICRAGALTIAELSMMGVASILVPFPFAVDDHQTHNGRFLTEAGGAKMFPQSLLDPKTLADVINDFNQNREKLLAMAKAAKTCAKPLALEHVITHCIEVSREPKPEPESESIS